MSIKFLCVTLWHMSICAGVVVAVPLQKIDNAPNAKSCSKSYNKGLQNAYCRIKKCHKFLLSCRVCGYPKKGIKNGGQFSNCRGHKSPRCLVSAARRYLVVKDKGICCMKAGGAYHVAHMDIGYSVSSFHWSSAVKSASSIS